MSRSTPSSHRFEYTPSALGASDSQSGRSESLLDSIIAAEPELQIEDAFPVPAWFCDQESWIRDSENSNSVIFNLPIYFRIQGQLLHSCLISAIQEVQRRHQSLRSVYRVVDRTLIQVVLRSVTLSVPVAFLKHVEGANPDSVLHDLTRQEAGRPFDLTHEPGFRAQLVQCSAEDHAVLITTHHLVCDDWSTGIITRQIFEYYRAFASGPSALVIEPDGFQYSDFIRWHREQMQGRGLQSRISFWRNYLAGKNESHHLPDDHRRQEARTWCGAIQTDVLSEELATSLKLLAQRERVSLFMTLLAAFQCVLFRYSGENDIAVGSCAANRSLTSAEDVVGRFANDLIIRTDFSGNPTFRELLIRVRSQALAAYSNQDLPFAKLVEELNPPASPGCNPSFQVMFILQDAPKAELSCPGLHISRLSHHMGNAKYDLCVLLTLRQGVEVALEYNTTLFERSTITQFLEEFKKVLREMVSDVSGHVKSSVVMRPSVQPTQRSIDIGRSSLLEHHGPMLSSLVEIWERGFGTRPIGIDDDFFQLGGDSLLASRLFAEIHNVFKVAIPIVTLINAPTIRKLADNIRESTSKRDQFRCTVLLQQGGARPPLFCAHGQSGNLLIYRGFAQYLGSDLPVYGLQPLGMQGNEDPLTRIEDMASTYLREVQTVQPKGPYFLAGYCMGGLIALEMASQLRREGYAVGLLALIDTYNVGMMKTSVFDDIIFGIQKWWFGWRHFLRIDPKYKFRYLKRRLHELESGTTKVSEANEVAALSYIPAVYPGRILHIYPTKQYTRYQRPELAWDGLAAGGVEKLALPIYPGQMFEEHSVRDLAAKVRSCINDVVEKEEKPAFGRRVVAFPH